MVRLALLVALVGMVVGCGTPRVQSYDQPGVQVLHSFPERDHEVLGSVSLRYYRPGWSEPTVDQARSKIVEAGEGLGADAVVVVRALTVGERTIQIHGEAIRYTD